MKSQGPTPANYVAYTEWQGSRPAVIVANPHGHNSCGMAAALFFQ